MSELLGHGDYRYRLIESWGNLDSTRFPVKNCHEMVQDSRGRLIMLGDETRNNILIYDRSGRLLDTWGHDFPGGHGLSLWNANGEEYLFITDTERKMVFKTDLTGNILLTIGHPSAVGAYHPNDPFSPTETAIGPDGSIYVTDGYGSQWVLKYSQEGEFITKFGGPGNGPEQFATVHGIAVDSRSSGDPTLLITSRVHNCFKRFTLDGEYVETIPLPGAYVCRPVIKDQTLYAGVCWSALYGPEPAPESGFVTILDSTNRVVSNPGGTEPVYIDGVLQTMRQSSPLFKHCNDVCVDENLDLYICQWKAGGTYPVKLERV